MPSRILMLAASALLVVAAACSDDDDATADRDSSRGDDTPATEDVPLGDVAASGTSSGGEATITIDGETWSFDSARCAVGEDEIGVEGAEMNMSAMDGSISLYVNVEGERTYIELTDLETMDDGGLHYSTTGVGTPTPTIDFDGSTVSSTADFYTYNDMGGMDGPFEGTLTGTCP